MANTEKKDAGSVIREWLTEYKGLAESSIPNYAKEISEKDDVLDALLHLFKVHPPHTTKSMNNLIQPVCHQLFEFYRSGFDELKTFTINLFPSIIRSHIIVSSAFSDSTSTDALLLSIYTLENLSQEKDIESPGLEIPQPGYSSIYHDAMTGIFSEQMWSMQNPSRKFYQKPVLPNHTVIVPANRFQILTQIMSIYSSHIATLKKSSHKSLCEICKLLASSGYTWQNKYIESYDETMQKSRRYPMSVEFMLKILRCVYFAMYNCQTEAFLATEAMQRRAKKELVPQVIFLCNAILNTAKLEHDEQTFGESSRGETAPYGLLSVNLTPILARESSRKGGRWAATAKSIKDHRWRHHNEEISGDLSRSLVNAEVQLHPPKVGQQSSDLDDSGKADKYSSTSPTKLLKSKLKKSAAGGILTEKSKSPAPSSGEEPKTRKNKKISTSTDEMEGEKPKLSPSQKKLSPTLTKKQSRTSIGIQKHPSMDESSSLNHKQRGFSGSKSFSDVDKYEVKLPTSITIDASYTSGDGNHDTSGTALLEGLKLDTSSESDDREISNDKKSVKSRHFSSDDKRKESFPLLSTSEAINTKSQTTAF
ncbi:hyccin-like [Styela clava]